MTQKEMLESVYKILVIGNGELPLREKVRNNEMHINLAMEQIKAIQQHMKSYPKKWRSWLTFGVTVLTFIVLLLTLIFGIIK